MRRPAPYVVRDPRWENAEFFQAWERAKQDYAIAQGADRERLANDLLGFEDYFFRRSR